MCSGTYGGIRETLRVGSFEFQRFINSAVLAQGAH